MLLSKARQDVYMLVVSVPTRERYLFTAAAFAALR
jgi:hypothetical protein